MLLFFHPNYPTFPYIRKNVVKFTYHDMLKKYTRKKCQLTYCNILGRHIRDILKKYITMKYRDMSVININDILNLNIFSICHDM